MSVKNSRGRALLSRTSNLLEKSSKQAKQATSGMNLLPVAIHTFMFVVLKYSNSFKNLILNNFVLLLCTDYSSLLLREGRGCCFVVEPPSTSLPPFTPVTLTLTAHSDMWGEYTDQLICKVCVSALSLWA